MNGPIAGTVSGTLELPDGDGTFAATSIIVDSAPAALGYTLSFDAILEFDNELFNTFTVIGGLIADAEYGAQRNASIGQAAGGLALSLSGFGSQLIPSNSNVADSGVVDFADATLSFGDVTPVPLPASLPLVLMGLAGLAGLRTRKTGAASAMGTEA